MANFEPNHICKNLNCTKGTDGKRKHYYACDFCSRTKSWRSVACSFECYQEYVNQVIEARSKGNKVSSLPERTDMTEKQVEELMEKPVELVKSESEKQLHEFSDIDGTVDFGKAVDEINKEIDKKSYYRTKKKR